jgi:hypothetical protein
LFLGVFLIVGVGSGASAQQQLASAAAAPSPVSTSATYEDALNCAMNYQLHAGEAEMQGLAEAKKARYGAGDKALEQAAKLAGKPASAVEDELMSRLDKALARPPSRAALTAAAKRCDGLLALTTP